MQPATPLNCLRFWLHFSLWPHYEEKTSLLSFDFLLKSADDQLSLQFMEYHKDTENDMKGMEWIEWGREINAEKGKSDFYPPL